ncbi:MAG: hypothetical protein SFX74_04830 [Fimbriimonadaceae bacterium]|nr:hypothetical protein [Fimbriimonadaceae bacterium]
MRSNRLFLAGVVLGSLGAIALIASVPIMQTYEGKAKLAQRVEKDDAGALFDEPYRNIGSPQLYVIDDPKAFLPTPEGGDPTIALLSDDYLKANNLYPTQLQSIRTIVNYGRIAAAGVFIMGDILMILALMRRRQAGSTA